MNKKLLVSLLMTPAISFAQPDAPFSPDLRGVHIVPEKEINMPSVFRMKSTSLLQEKKLGYRENDGDLAKKLLNIKETAKKEMASQDNRKYGVYDTGLKYSPREIKLGFPFEGIKGINPQDVIGFAAIGSFQENGWNGVTEIFTHPKFGNCQYSFVKILAIQLSKETTQYLINGKPTSKLIQGNPHDGFHYSIEWYTEKNNITTSSSLECANKSFKSEIMDGMIELANVIDKQG